MTLLASRQEFVDYSGRYDLVVDTTNYVDAGANKFIRAGQRWLDHTFDIGAQEGIHYASIVAGNWHALVPLARTLHEVWMSLDADGKKWQLRPLNQTEWRDEAPKDPAQIASGKPVFWTRAVLRGVPESATTITVSKFGAVTYSVTGGQWDFNGIVWTPPVDRATTLEVHGDFYHLELITDGDKNFWTEKWSHVLVMAACRALEQSYRNMAGMQDWEAAIRSELFGMELDTAAGQSVGITQMEGKGL